MCDRIKQFTRIRSTINSLLQQNFFIKYLIVILQAYQHVHLKVGTRVCNLSLGVYSNMLQTKKSRSMSRSRELQKKKIAKIKSRAELSPKRRERKKIYQSPASSSDHPQ